MSSQTIKNARIRTDAITTALLTHAQPAAEEADAIRRAAGLEPLGLGSAVVAVAGSLPVTCERFDASEGLVTRETGEDDAAKGKREALKAALYGAVSRLGQSAETAYGRPTVKALNLEGTTPQNVESLLAFTRGFLNATVVMPELPPPLEEWNVPNLPAARAKIEELTVALEEASRGAKTEDRETQKARSARNGAEVVWTREARFASELARAILNYVGQEDLAARVLDGVGASGGGSPTGGETPEGDEPAEPTEPIPTPTA